MLGDWHMDQGEFGVAEKIFEEALEYDDADPIIWNNLGSSCLQLQKFEKAKTCFERVIVLYP